MPSFPNPITIFIRFEISVDENGLVPLEYQESMRRHSAALKRLDAALRGGAPAGWAPKQAEMARQQLAAAYKAYRETCERVAALPVEERRALDQHAKAVVNRYHAVDKVTSRVAPFLKAFAALLFLPLLEYVSKHLMVKNIVGPMDGF